MEGETVNLVRQTTIQSNYTIYIGWSRMASNVCLLTIVLRMRSSGVVVSLGGLEELNSAMSASMLSMVV